MSRAVRALHASLFLSVFVALAVPGCGGTSDTDAGTGEAGPSVDANMDANADAAPECSGDIDCDDGLFCNGTEHCTAGRCEAGTRPACSDSVDCTRDFCSEDRRTCVHQVPDADADGHGDATCRDGVGVALGDDCDDTDATTFPGNVEVCDAMRHDEDCDPTTHGRIDADSDGFEDAACCNGSACGDDCDDSNRSVSPSATEVCDHIDDDCDGNVDEGVGVRMYPDEDRDGYGAAGAMAVTQCGDTVGFSTLGGDCDDTRIDRSPGQLELCDSVDNDCDTTVDESTGAVNWYPDTDHDGYGAVGGTPLVQCDPPGVGWSLLATDCDDTTNTRSPRVAEICNGLDDDCNGRADFIVPGGGGDLEDDDRDGVADAHCGGADCNDRSASTRPGATEICNGRDDDCDARVDEDAVSTAFHSDRDGDGYGDPGTTVLACFAPTGYVSDASDCDDAAGARHPGASEFCNATDDDCDRRIDETPAESSCRIPGAVAACTVGICRAMGCAAGFSDCTTAPGCETPTLVDDAHCGGCTSACGAGAQCVRSNCVAGAFGAIEGASNMDDFGTAIVVSPGVAMVLGGSFSGSSFGIGCGTSFDARGEAGIVSLRDDAGHCSHAIALDGTGDERVVGVAMDGAGSVFVVLTTTSDTLSIGSIAVNAGAGQGMQDIVVVRLDTSLVPVWARRFGGAFDDVASDVILDASGLLLTGAMRGPVTLGTLSIGASANGDAFVLRLAPGDGAPQNVATSAFAGIDGALDFESNGDSVFVVGTFEGTGSFAGTTLTSAGATDGFLWVLGETDLTTSFVRRLGGAGADALTGVTLSGGLSMADVVVSGWFEQTVSIDALGTQTSAGLRDGIVVGFSAPSGYTALWAVPFGGTGDDVLNDVAFDSLNGFTVIGTFSGMPLLGGDGGIGSAGGTDAIVFGITTQGNVGFPATLGGSGNDQGLGIYTDGGGSVFITGSSSSAWSWFGANLRPLGGFDAFWITYRDARG